MGDASNETRALMKAWGVRAVPEFRFFLDEELAHSHTGANKEPKDCEPNIFCIQAVSFGFCDGSRVSS
jgi:hypothetical protein